MATPHLRTVQAHDLLCLRRLFLPTHIHTTTRVLRVCLCHGGFGRNMIDMSICSATRRTVPYDDGPTAKRSAPSIRGWTCSARSDGWARIVRRWVAVRFMVSRERWSRGDERLSTTLQCHSLGLGFYCFASCRIMFFGICATSVEILCITTSTIFTRCVVVDSGNVIRRDTNLTRVNVLIQKVLELD